jgi:hypothetical protein
MGTRRAPSAACSLNVSTEPAPMADPNRYEAAADNNRMVPGWRKKNMFHAIARHCPQLLSTCRFLVFMS